MMYIVPTLGGQPDPAAARSLLERGGQRRGRLHKNVCGIPQSAPFFSLARHPCFRSLPLSFASAAFVVSFIIPLICCAPARDHHNLSRMYFFCLVFHTVHVCMCLCLCISYVCLFPPWNVRFKCLLLILSFLLVFSLSLAASFRTHSASCARL